MGARMPDAPVILKPHAPVAERVLLPGDPGRALRLAQQLIDGPRMLNHHRGLWGYTGPAADGAPLTIQSTGLGGPSAAAVVAELVGLGARRLVRVGTAAGLGATPLGTLVVVEAALAGDGASRALGAGRPRGRRRRADRGAARRPARPGRLGRRARPGAAPGTGRAQGALAADLATAAVLAAAARARGHGRRRPRRHARGRAAARRRRDRAARGGARRGAGAAALR